jgi:hypothetical protein
MRKLLLLSLLALSAGIKAQTVPTYFFGQNAWMPDSIGSIPYYGQLHNKWSEVSASGAKLVRFGGIGPDHHMPTLHQYLKMVDKIRANGMEPMLQVPYYNGLYNASQAAEIVKYINVTMGRNVKYWIVANEPDNEYHFTAASQLSPYLKAYSYAMKNVDPTIKIIGPETAWYNTGIIDGLTNPGGPDDVTGKDNKGRYILDIISFHAYGFNGTQTRAQVLSNITAPWKLQENLTALNQRIANCNQQHGRTGDAALKTAITEANVSYINAASDNLYGQGANSFLGGQYWLEMMGVALQKGVSFFTPWSVIEGNNTVYNIGYLDYVSGKKKPTYYHYKMMAENFSGSMVSSEDNHANVKVFSCKNATGITVLILNQDESTSLSYSVNLNNTYATGSSALKIKVAGGVTSTFNDQIDQQATQVLIFDLQGNLKKKIEYKLYGHADADLPPSEYDGNIATGMTKEALEKNLAVYPNPSKGEFTVEINSIGGFEDNIPMKVINEIGQVVIEETLTPANGKVRQTIQPNADLASGLYFIQLEVKDKMIVKKLLVRK